METAHKTDHQTIFLDKLVLVLRFLKVTIIFKLVQIKAIGGEKQWPCYRK